MAKSKKQKAADKAFIAKIATLGIKVGSKPKGAAPTMECPDCGLTGTLAGSLFGKPLYVADAPLQLARPSRAQSPVNTDDQVSLSE